MYLRQKRGVDIWSVFILLFWWQFLAFRIWQLHAFCWCSLYHSNYRDFFMFFRVSHLLSLVVACPHFYLFPLIGRRALQGFLVYLSILLKLRSFNFKLTSIEWCHIQLFHYFYFLRLLFISIFLRVNFREIGTGNFGIVFPKLSSRLDFFCEWTGWILLCDSEGLWAQVCLSS